jgi:hypothetical protein
MRVSEEAAGLGCDCHGGTLEHFEGKSPHEQRRVVRVAWSCNARVATLLLACTRLIIRIRIYGEINYRLTTEESQSIAYRSRIIDNCTGSNMCS